MEGEVEGEEAAGEEGYPGGEGGGEGEHRSDEPLGPVLPCDSPRTVCIKGNLKKVRGGVPG